MIMTGPYEAAASSGPVTSINWSVSNDGDVRKLSKPGKT
jgi:hypothetical protein